MRLKEIKESDHQKAVVAWFRAQYPKHIRCLQASASGAVLGGNVRARAMQMNSLKACGLVIGQCDLFLAMPNKEYHGLYIEMKSLKGRLSEEQDLFITDMLTHGYDAYVAFGADEAVNKIKSYMELI